MQLCNLALHKVDTCAIVFCTSCTSAEVPYSYMKEEEKLKAVREIFLKLKEAHPFVRSGNNEQQRRIVDVLQPKIDRAVALGVPQGFCEAILFWGKEFLDFEFGEKDSGKKKEQSGQSSQVSQQVIDAQRVFGVKHKPVTFGEREAAKMASSQGALVYKILGYSQKEKDEGGNPIGKYAPDIEILVKKK